MRTGSCAAGIGAAGALTARGGTTGGSTAGAGRGGATTGRGAGARGTAGWGCAVRAFFAFFEMLAMTPTTTKTIQKRTGKWCIVRYFSGGCGGCV